MSKKDVPAAEARSLLAAGGYVSLS